MTTFWSMPCKHGTSERYHHGWMAAVGDRWRVLKEHKGTRRRITRWYLGYSKAIRPNRAKKHEERRWRLMGYEDRRERPSARIPHSF